MNKVLLTVILSISIFRSTEAAEPSPDLTPATLTRLERLSKMSVEQRALMLANVPVAPRARIAKGLSQLDALTPQQRQDWFNRYRRFIEFPPAEKDAVRVVVKSLQSLPVSRRMAVRKEIETYNHMPMWARQARILSADFRNKFNPGEREIVQRGAALIPEPVATQGLARKAN